jgi:hypothetical protein
VLVPDIAFADRKTDGCGDGWNPPSAGPIVTWTAPVCERGRLSLQPFLSYQRTRGVFNEDGHYKAFTDKDKKWQWSQTLFLQYGITDRWEIDGQGSYQQNTRQVNGRSAEAAGFADTYIYSSYCVLTEKGILPCIAGWFQLKMPTGKYQKSDPDKLGADIMGTNSIEGSYDHGYGFIITKKMKPFIFHADAIWSFPLLTRIDGVKVQNGMYAKYDLGMEYFFYKGFNLMLELNSFHKADRRDNSDYVPASDSVYLNISPGIGWSSKDIQTLISYQRTIAGINTDVNDSFVATFVLTF